MSAATPFDKALDKATCFIAHYEKTDPGWPIRPLREQAAMILLADQPTTSDPTAKHCPICGRRFTRPAYGKQTYCRDCWKPYSNLRAYALRHDLPTDTVLRQVRDTRVKVCPACNRIVRVPPNGQVVECSCGRDMVTVPTIKRSELGAAYQSTEITHENL